MELQQQVKTDKEGSIPNHQQKQIEVLVGIEFGIPSKDCKNFGICHITGYNSISTKLFEEESCGCNHAFATIVYQANHTLLIKFHRSNMSDQVNKKYFSEQHFKIEETYSLMLSNTDTGSIQHIINKGAYPILKTSTFYIINV